MVESSITTQDSNLPFIFAIGLAILGLVITAIVIFFCCKTKNDDQKNPRRASTSTIESFQQLYFTKKPNEQIPNIEQRIIQRWSSAEQPSMTFYRVHMQDNSDNLYQPVTEERLRTTIEQSKAMEYAGHEIIFF